MTDRRTLYFLISVFRIISFFFYTKFFKNVTCCIPELHFADGRTFHWWKESSVVIGTMSLDAAHNFLLIYKMFILLFYNSIQGSIQLRKFTPSKPSYLKYAWKNLFKDLETKRYLWHGFQVSLELPNPLFS